jgi:hypothetical protein
MSDSTWKYDSPAPAGCQSIKDNLSFCSQNGEWSQVATASNEIAAQFRRDDRNYGIFIVEEVGSDDGITEDFMANMAIKHAARTAGMQSQDVATIESEPTTVDGRPGKSITYAVKIQGLPAVFTNTIVVDKHRTVQVVTYGVGQTLTAEMKLNHKSFLAGTRLQ